MSLKYLIFDIETSGIKTNKRFCNPLDLSNEITLVGWKKGGLDYTYIYEYDGIKKDAIFSTIGLTDVDIIVGHNLKFDLLWSWGDPELKAFIKRGGMLFDTLTAQYLIDGQQKIPRSLDDLSIKYGGTLKDDVMKQHYKEGGLSKTAPKDVLIEYNKEDINNTLIVFRKQIEICRQKGLIDIVKVYMSHYRAIIEMEYNGMYVNKESLRKTSDSLTEEKEEYERRIRAYTDHHDYNGYNPASLDHLSLFLFGGVQKVREKRPCFDEEGIPIFVKKTGLQKEKLEDVLVERSGLLRPCKSLIKNKKGLYVLDEETLSELKSSNEEINVFINNILGYRKVVKLLSTYYKGLTECTSSYTGCIHPEFKTSSTFTGRLSCTNPNLQNLHPSCLEVFESRYGDEGVLIEIDYCLSPGTKVLDEEFVWRNIETFKPGEKLIGFEEHVSTHNGRKFTLGTVTKTKRLIKPCLKLITSEGELTCSEDHMFLASAASSVLQWVKAKNLTLKHTLSKVMEVWETPNNNETGWMGGFLDGEGYLSNNSQIGVGQNDDGDNKLCLDKALAMFDKYLVNTENRLDRKRRCVKVRPAGLRTGFQAVGVFQPERLKAKLKRGFAEGTSVRSKRNRKVSLLSIEHIGEREVIALETDCHTFLAEGILSHNCQLEIRLGAYLTGCQNMVKDFSDGVDFHTLRLAYAEEKPYEDVLKLVQEDHEWTLKRKKIGKPISFGKQYAASAQTISENSGLPVDIVEKVFKAEDERYPEFSNFFSKLSDYCERNRSVSSELLQIRDKKTGAYFTKPYEQQGFCSYKSITGKIYTFKEKAVLTKNSTIFRYFHRPELQNYPTQGIAGDFVAMQVGRLYDWLLQSGAKCRLVNEIHDAVLLDCHITNLTNVKEQAKLILEDTSFFEKLTGKKFKTNMPVDISIGKTWSEVKEQ